MRLYTNPISCHLHTTSQDGREISQRRHTLACPWKSASDLLTIPSLFTACFLIRFNPWYVSTSRQAPSFLFCCCQCCCSRFQLCTYLCKASCEAHCQPCRTCYRTHFPGSNRRQSYNIGFWASGAIYRLDWGGYGISHSRAFIHFGKLSKPTIAYPGTVQIIDFDLEKVYRTEPFVLDHDDHRNHSQ